MTYALFDSTGNLIESFDDRVEAIEALLRIAHDHPDAAEDVAMLTFDEHGQAVGDAVTIDASGAFATH